MTKKRVTQIPDDEQEFDRQKAIMEIVLSSVYEKNIKPDIIKTVEGTMSLTSRENDRRYNGHKVWLISLSGAVAVLGFVSWYLWSLVGVFRNY